MMRALLLDRPGPPSSLRVGEAARPVPAIGEVLVRVDAVGLNPVDYQVASGGHADWVYPHIPGLDIAGVVHDAGPEPGPRLPVGTRVAWHQDLRRPGGLADFVTVPAAVLAVVPAEVGMTVAASLPCAGMTAYQAVVRRLRAERGQYALVHGAAGGVGGFAVQLLAAAGATVIATASPPNHAYVRSLGADVVLDYRRADLPAALRAATGQRGFDAVVDTVSPESAAEGLLLLRHAGGLASVAGRPSLDSVPPFGIAPSLHEIALGAAYTHGDARSRADLALMLTELLRLVAEGTLSPLPIENVRLEDAPEALERLARRHVRGKIVVQLEGS
ncbi:zinc-binding dehydrogenase [Arthrobacter sp. C9C5]|uniref:zinc-binding dehydrogenase n=1 Tax=Arthrobacter sp. C9C5 TaxID=2735267 RepID=UPI001584CB0E|nr:zinc-binding dehydrogenase [Arthrobacter sp. C9C5]NUU31814.1 zinc-binding dehydrogenase [Arthrobacter sp. C9C5]